MKHDFRTSSDPAAAERFLAWLEAETIDGLRRCYGNAEATKGIVFLFVHRAYESHMPEDLIAEMFAKCVVRAGYREEDQEALFACLELHATIAKAVDGGA